MSAPVSSQSRVVGRARGGWQPGQALRLSLARSATDVQAFRPGDHHAALATKSGHHQGDEGQTARGWHAAVGQRGDAADRTAVMNHPRPSPSRRPASAGNRRGWPATPVAMARSAAAQGVWDGRTAFTPGAPRLRVSGSIRQMASEGLRPRATSPGRSAVVGLQTKTEPRPRAPLHLKGRDIAARALPGAPAQERSAPSATTRGTDSAGEIRRRSEGDHAVSNTYAGHEEETPAATIRSAWQHVRWRRGLKSLWRRSSPAD